MHYTISSLDPTEIRGQSEKGRVASSKLYYEIRKDFGPRWKKFETPDRVLDTIDFLLGECLLKMQTALDKTPVESRCCDWAGLNTTGINVNLRWTRFSEQDRTTYFEKYRGLQLNDYVTLNITFEIIDSYQHREERYDIHKP